MRAALKHKLLLGAVVALLVGLAGTAIWMRPRRSALSEKERALLASIPDTPDKPGDQRAPGPPLSPRPSPPSEPCVGTIREYCQERPGGRCPTYAQSIEGVKKLCEQRSSLPRILVEHCVGGYRSISVQGLFGSDQYFDASGKLVAAFVVTDYIGSLCDGASTKTYGRIPVCSTEYVKIDVCKGQPPDGG
jgi:hypothetical protein